MKYNKKVITTNNHIEVYEYKNSIRKGYKRKSTLETNQVKHSERNRLKWLARTRLNAKHEFMRLVDMNYNLHSKFLTLTPKENIQDRDEFNKIFDKFMKRLNYYCFKTKKKKIKYVGVYEKQKRGAYHVHLMIFNLPFVPHKVLLDLWGLGAVNIKAIKVDSQENVGRYVAKYMEKGIGQELLESLGKKSYLSSRNLKRLQVIKFLDSENLEDLIDEKNILVKSEYNSKIYINGELKNNKVTYWKIKR